MPPGKQIERAVKSPVVEAPQMTALGALRALTSLSSMATKSVALRHSTARFSPIAIRTKAGDATGMLIRPVIANAVLGSVLVAEIVGAAIKLAGG
jgi:hypothetical protein